MGFSRKSPPLELVRYHPEQSRHYRPKAPGPLSAQVRFTCRNVADDGRTPALLSRRSATRLGFLGQHDAAVTWRAGAGNCVAAQCSRGHFLPRRQGDDRIAAERAIEPEGRFRRHPRNCLERGLRHCGGELTVELLEYGLDIDTHGTCLHNFATLAAEAAR